MKTENCPDRPGSVMASPSARSRSITVIGSGIAGCAACLGLTRRGLDVIWIAPDTRLENKPGESLAAASLPVLENLGLDHLLLDPEHRKALLSFTAWGSDMLLERHGAAQPGGMGYVIDRRHFEAALVHETRRKSGVHWIDGSLAAFARGKAGWVLTTSDGEMREVSLLVDATGRRAMVGRTQARQRRLDRLVAAYAFLHQSGSDIDPTPATLIEAVEDGWWYATLLADRRLALNFYTDPDLLPRKIGQRQDLWKTMVEATRYVRRWVESADYQLSGPPHLASAGTVWLEETAGPDWLAIGDAAISFDPLSSHGMTTALWTGEQAADAVARTLDGDGTALDQYSARLRSGVEDYVAGRRNIYARETRFARHPFWQRRQNAGSVASDPEKSAGH